MTAHMKAAAAARSPSENFDMFFPPEENQHRFNEA
jgi:hypothetical protein